MNWQTLKHASLDDILAWAESQPWCRAMADCAQDAEWHSEGDVWTHTKMVCQQLAKLDDWSTLTSDEQTVLFFTALFHDAAKPLTSECDPETGRITSPKHAVKGEYLTRAILRDLDCDLATREQIAHLVRFHGRPAFLLFFRQREPNLLYVPHEAYACRVTVLAGLPGSGKDTWLARNRGGLPVVSLDAIRGELDVAPTDNQGDVVQLARERCREFLRTKTDFAFNATNLLKQTRQRWIDLLADYNARIELVYIEPPFERLLRQNKGRKNSVPEQVVRKLAAKCEPPTWSECHTLLLVDGATG